MVMKCARLLKDLRLRLEVVDGDGDEGVGHIGLVYADTAERPIRGKLYT